MSKKIIIPLILITVLLIGSITLAFSYAMWNVTKEQTNENVVESGCLNLEIQNEENAISLNNAYPITDSEASRLVPYTFTIKNTCTIASKYTINLEMLSDTNLNLNYVATKIDNEEKRILGNITKNGEKTINNSVASKTIKEGLLAPSKSVEIELRVWMNESVSLNDDAENKILNAKVVVIGETISEEYCRSIIGTIWNFDYVEDESGNGYSQEFIIPCTGTYKLETWGAQGGNCNQEPNTDIILPGGYGGYSVGEVIMNMNTEIFVTVGGAGTWGHHVGSHVGSDDSYISDEYSGGYNGGGDSHVNYYNAFSAGSGGGATHIATIFGELATLSDNISSILIVSGGGGGALSYYDTINNAKWKTTDYLGSGGGYIGVSPLHTNYGTDYADNVMPIGGTQSEGGTGQYIGLFGTGKKDLPNNRRIISGGGGGFYGGSSSDFIGASGGSGYINNKLLKNKSMYTYCEEDCDKYKSEAEETKTIITRNVSEIATTGYAKKGNGYARITYLGGISRK